MTRAPKVDAFMLPGGWPFFTDGICAECRCEGKKHAKRFPLRRVPRVPDAGRSQNCIRAPSGSLAKRALEELRTRPYDYLVDKCGRPFADAAIPRPLLHPRGTQRHLDRARTPGHARLLP